MIKKMLTVLMCLLILSITLRFTSSFDRAIAQYYQPTINGKITVYPSGKVALAGNMSQVLTGINPTIHSAVQFSQSGGKVKIEGETSMTIPYEMESQFPFENMDINSNSQFSNGLYNLSATISFRVKSQIDSQLNVSDFSANGRFDNGNFVGSIAVHLIPGFSLGQVEMDFYGNQSYIHISGNTTVYYTGGITPDMVNDVITYLEANVTGRGPYSLYNMTLGAFECITLDITNSSLPNGVFVSFEAAIVSLQGTFFDSTLYLLTAFLTNEVPSPYMYSTVIVPLIACVTILPLSMICETSTNGSFQAVYAHSTRQFSMSTNIAANYDAVIERIIAIISELSTIPSFPPELVLLLPHLENILRQEYCHIESSTATLHYANSILDYQGIEYIAGDLNAAVNHAKAELFEWLKIIFLPNWNWQLDYLNQTTIDITSFKYGYDIAGNQLIMHFENFVLRPPVDIQTATSFQLKRFFNLTYGMPPPPIQFTLTIEGGSNVTHYVTITRPASVPPPSSSSPDGKSMTWSNPIISSLQDLTFNVNHDPTAIGFSITNPASLSETNPFVCDATELASVVIFVKQASCSMSIAVRNLTGPPSGGDTPPSGFKFLGKYVEIVCEPSDVPVQATIRFCYTDEQLKAANIDEASLKVFYWNTASNQWEEYPSTINMAKNYVEINVTHFSVWALMGQPPTPIWSQPWFIATIAAIIITVAAVAIFAAKRRKPKVPEAPPFTSSTSSTENQ
ncbi:MAG: hypothetical protein QXJ31_03690 [Candidatus Bathyarchaeia archaeon]